MSVIRVIYMEGTPTFPATDQHPDAVRYTVYSHVLDKNVTVDALGGAPSSAAVDALLAPPVPPTPAEKLAASGLTVQDLKDLLGLA